MRGSSFVPGGRLSGWGNVLKEQGIHPGTVGNGGSKRPARAGPSDNVGPGNGGPPGQLKKESNLVNPASGVTTLVQKVAKQVAKSRKEKIASEAKAEAQLQDGAEELSQVDVKAAAKVLSDLQEDLEDEPDSQEKELVEEALAQLKVYAEKIKSILCPYHTRFLRVQFEAKAPQHNFYLSYHFLAITPKQDNKIIGVSDQRSRYSRQLEHLIE